MILRPQGGRPISGLATTVASSTILSFFSQDVVYSEKDVEISLEVYRTHSE